MKQRPSFLDTSKDPDMSDFMPAIFQECLEMLFLGVSTSFFSKIWRDGQLLTPDSSSVQKNVLGTLCRYLFARPLQTNVKSLTWKCKGKCNGKILFHIEISPHVASLDIFINLLIYRDVKSNCYFYGLFWLLF